VISPLIYLLAYVPQVIVSNWFFFFTMGHRGFEPRKLFLSQCLVVATYPVYAAAAMAAALHQKRAFAVTPKGVGQTLPWSALRWQILTFLVLAAAVIAGGIKSVLSLSPVLAINIGWCIYHGILLSMGLRFNLPERDLSHEKLIAVDYPSVAQHGGMPSLCVARIVTLAHRLRVQSEWIGNARRAIFDMGASAPDISARRTHKLTPVALDNVGAQRSADITWQRTRKLIHVALDGDISQQHTRPLCRVKIDQHLHSRLNTVRLCDLYERMPTRPLRQTRRQPANVRAEILTY